MKHNFSSLKLLLQFGIENLNNSLITNAHHEAKWILLDILNKDSGWFIINQHHPPTESTISRFCESIYKRSDHIPLQLIMGKATFYNRDFKVFPDVFIPRYETEGIIEILKKKFFPRF